MRLPEEIVDYLDAIRTPEYKRPKDSEYAPISEESLRELAIRAIDAGFKSGEEFGAPAEIPKKQVRK